MTLLSGTLSSVNTPTLLLSHQGHTIELFEEDRPHACYQNKTFDSLTQTLAGIPGIHNRRSLTTFAKLANFFLMGGDYAVIEDVAAFRSQYGDTLPSPQTDESSPDQPDDRLDLSSLQPPTLESPGLLTFWVVARQTGIPYKVTTPHPKIRPDDEVSYQMPPFLAS